jgi:hypothetical protein
MPEANQEGKILLTLQALQNNPKLSAQGATKIYKVNPRTLQRRRRGIQSRRDIIHRLRKLSKSEEDILLQSILDQILRGFPPQIRIIEEMANQLLADRDALPVGKRWAINFIKRQPQLKTRFPRRYDYKRALYKDPTIIRNWFRLIENTIAKYGIYTDNIWNFNETGFIMGMISTGKVVISIETHRKPKSVQPGNRE